MDTRRHVIVIGAGIVGASLAWHLGRAGSRVTVVEAEREPGGLATRASFSWINAAAGNPEAYFRLRMAAIAGWRRLAAEVAGLGVRFPGGLAWDLPRPELEAYCAAHAGWGYRIRLVERDEIARLEPNIATPPDCAVFAEDEGMVEAPGAARALMAASGADVLGLEQVDAIRLDGGRVAGIAGSVNLDADAVVVAAGVASPDLLSTAGVDFQLDSPAGLLMYTRPHRRLIERLLVAERLHVRQAADGRFFAGTDFLGTFDAERPEETVMDLMAGISGLLRGTQGLEPEGFTIGERPTPRDGFPALGAVPGIAGLYVAVTHSGVTLAPAVGEFLAREIETGEVDPLIAPYRFSRFLQD
jgi:glycine/D-amino acid oxidase-like deaminating enzyme